MGLRFDGLSDGFAQISQSWTTKSSMASHEPYARDLRQHQEYGGDKRTRFDHEIRDYPTDTVTNRLCYQSREENEGKERAERAQRLGKTTIKRSDGVQSRSGRDLQSCPTAVFPATDCDMC